MAKLTEDWQPVTLKPLTGVLDSRSSTEDVPSGAFRQKMNLMLSGSKLCRRPGFDVFFSGATPYTNFDFHDQSDISAQRVRQAITMLFATFSSANNQRYLYAGTQSNFFWLNEATGLWTCPTAGKSFGGTVQPGVAQTRWKAAALQNVIVATNNVDLVQQTAIGGNTVSGIPELDGSGGIQYSLGLTAAAVVIQFGGFIFLMNTVEQGTNFPSRVRWCDLNRPTVWIGGSISSSGSFGTTAGVDPNFPAMVGGNPNPLYPSIADFQDLDYGETILAAGILGGQLWIYTDKSIWVSLLNAGGGTGGNYTSAWGFFKRYSDPQSNGKCLFFPNSLVSAGQSHYYAGQDGFYRMDPYIPEPDRVDWLYQGSAAIYGDTAYIGDIANCQSLIGGIIVEDREIHYSWPELNVSGAQPGQATKTIIFNYELKSVDIEDTGYTAFANYSPNTPGICKTKQLFVAASAVDNCIKQITSTYSREICTNATTGVGSTSNGVYTPFTGVYAASGYASLFRGLFPFLNFDREKEIKHMILEAHPDAQLSPCIVRCRLGWSYSEADPNLPDGQCTVIWRTLPDMVLACRSKLTGAQQFAANTFSAQGIAEWDVLVRGKFLYYEFQVLNVDGSPAIGGSGCFSRLETQTRILPAPNV